jgi:hypothetical protein
MGKKEAGMRKQTRTLFMIILLNICVGLSPFAISAQDVSLVDLLMQQLGVTQPQAQGGAGALFNSAKQALSPQEFDQVAATVPEMDSLLEAAPKSSGTLNDMMGQGSSLFGGEANKQLGGAMDLANSFSELGLSPEMVNKYVPVVLDYVESKGGETVRNLLASALL